MRTIYVIDDNAGFRSSMQWLLASAGYQVCEFADPAQALQTLGAQPPAQAACVLMDVRMPGMNGLELHERLLAAGVSLPVIYMTGHGDVPLAVQAMQKGAVTFLEKPFGDQLLEEALERAFSTELPRAVPPAGAAPPAAEPVDPAATQWQARFDRLTPREREVLHWVLEDKLNKTIADLMGISIKTVELHRSRVMAKLEAVSLTHLLKMAVSGKVQP